MKKYPKVSIIIPLYVICERFFEDLKKFEELKYPNYEILIVCDKKIEIDNPKARLILTGKKMTGPAEKRDLAIKITGSEICAFIDDDAYPDPDWLKNAVKILGGKRIAATGGPGITPTEDPYWAQLTGLVYSSFFCGGLARHRFVKEKARYTTDFPAYNLIVKTEILKEIGGYGSSFYGGEDTFLCLKMVKRGWRIYYSPKVVIYHHRRPLFLPYLKQINNVGIHRGYFAKEFPETSRRISYFLPSILTIGFFSGLCFSFVSSTIQTLFLGGVTIFLLLGAGSVIRKTNIINAIIVSAVIILTHIAYGTGFIKGLLTKELTR